MGSPTTVVECLVLAAHPVELEYLRMRLADAPTPGAQTSVVGVGLVSAAAGTMRALTEHKPQRAILVGSAGNYPNLDMPIGTLGLASAIHLADAAVASGHAAFPAPMSLVSKVDPQLLRAGRAAIPTASGLRVATTLAITTDDATASTLGAHGPFDVENLEALAVAEACRTAGVPFGALLGITNAVGSHGRKQWLDNHAAVAEAVAEALLRWLQALGRVGSR